MLSRLSISCEAEESNSGWIGDEVELYSDSDSSSLSESEIEISPKFSTNSSIEACVSVEDLSFDSGVGAKKRRNDPAPSATQTQEPKTKVSLCWKATVSLMMTRAIEFASGSTTRSPTWRASCQCFRHRAYDGVPEVVDCAVGLAEIRNTMVRHGAHN